MPLVPLGVPDTIVAELQGLVSRFEEADRGGRAGRSVRAAVKARLAEAFEPATEPLRLLDVIVANIFAHDDAVRAEWKRARHVPSSRARGESTVTTKPESAETPASPDAPKREAVAPPPASGETLQKAS